MSDLVSIVIPAYNADKLIERTLLSIAAQDYENIEIIVVDDGSRDDTAEAAERALKTAGRKFKIIKHEANAGVSAARNSGLRAASGDYVIFFDADDLADPDFVSALLKAITENDSDTAFCGYRFRYSDTGKEWVVPFGLDAARKYSNGELVVMYLANKIGAAMWSMIYKTSFLKNTGLEFCGLAGEDMEFSIKALSRCVSINFSAGCHYIYVQHGNQTTKTARENREVFLRRYKSTAEATCRTARYLMKHSDSARVRDVAGNYLLAEGLVNTLTAAARRHDREEFYRTLGEPETRPALRACFRYLKPYPELVFKAAALLAVPGLYYLIRSKSWK